MISSNLPSNAANLIASFQSVGQQPVGLENSASRNSPLKPVEQLSSIGRQQFGTREPGSSDLAGNNTLEQNLSPGEAPEEGAVTAESQQEQALEQRRLEQERQEIQELAARDREVRAHEQAHAAVGGQYAGAASFQYERGPDGVRYAVGGEVPIDVGKEATPQETIVKAQIVKRAALAPAEPSPQDRSVAAEASRLESEARRELSLEKSEEQQAEQDVSDTTAPDPQFSSEAAKPDETGAEKKERESALDFVRTADSLISSRLSQGIANTSLSSRSPGSILDQLA
ncbi:SprA-related family protein [Alteromonadaceae bacterium Bs31]|nr:SprA-related family protein [Alteromonadaceae bacterium Bs31]